MRISLKGLKMARVCHLSMAVVDRLTAPQYEWRFSTGQAGVTVLIIVYRGQKRCVILERKEREASATYLRDC